MKKIIALLLILVTVLSFVACNEESGYSDDSNFINSSSNNNKKQKEESATTHSTPSKTQLKAPVISIDLEAQTIDWFVIENAETYKIYFNNSEIEIPGTVFNYSNYPKGTYIIKVKAIPKDNSNYLTSEYSNAITINHDPINYEELINKISTDTIKACVNITNKQYNTFLGFETTSQTSIGSGVIFRETQSNNKYFYMVLTNYHVVEKSSKYKNVKYTIEDYQGNQYDGYIHPNQSTDGNANCQKNDLTVMYFWSTKRLKALNLASANPKITDKIISIGQPKGQNNTITIGECTNYRTVTLTNGFTTPYLAFIHSSPTNNGSSGGAIINTNHEIVGIHFAGSKDNNGNFLYGCGIPVETIKTFIKFYEISV